MKDADAKQSTKSVPGQNPNTPNRWLWLIPFVFVAPSCLGASLSFVGSGDYTVAGNSVVLQADKLQNNDLRGSSGVIFLELWAFSQPYPGATTGYQLASHPLGLLNASSYFSSINSGPVQFTLPPPGLWYFSLLAREFGAGTGFATRDSIDFATPVRVAGGAFWRDVQIIGQPIWGIAGGNVNLNVEKVENICDLGTSGSLRLDLWATTSPYSGGTITGYRFASVPLDPLPGKSFYDQINETVAYSKPPDGLYFVTFTLSENDTGNYVIVDYQNSSGPIAFGPPPPPTATAATGVTNTGFTANWSSVIGAAGYMLDVSADSAFNSFLSGYQNLNMSSALRRPVSGLNPGTPYYYRVRAYSGSGTSGNSGTIMVATACTHTITTGSSLAGTTSGGGIKNCGATVTVTATPNAGYRFANWTEAGVVISTSSSYTFPALNDRALVANFVDAQGPQVTITSPAAGIRVSNEVMDVKGIASDNDQVSSVWISVNGAGFASAAIQNGGRNWVLAAQSLRPGTNTVRAYAADASGNLSVTSSVSFTHFVTAPLLVQNNGGGSVSPDYNGRLLEIDKSFTITAKAAVGFAFAKWVVATNSNWGAGLLVTNAALSFVMRSNLTLQATFKDVTKPTLLITFPVASGRVTNSATPLTMRGKAGDNAQVAAVRYQLNWGTWADAAPATNWTALLTPAAGTNVIKAYALDGAGNSSPTNTVTFIYVVTSPLAVLTNGLGGITRSFTGNQLEIGRSYTVTALPGVGQVFSNWVGTLTSTNRVLKFLMQSNMVLQANFIPNPFAPAKGVYNGLFAEETRVHEHSGFLTLTLTDQGTYTASLRRGTNSYALSGQFDLTGQAGKSITVGGSNWVVTMALDLAGTEQLAGSVSDGQWVANLTAVRAAFNAQTNPAVQYAGRYTLIVPGTIGDASLPEGNGYGAVVVDRAGKVVLNGSLADGTPVSQSVAISHDGRWPLYVSQSNGKGSIWSWLAFDNNQPSAALAGDLSWIKTTQSSAQFYPAGFTIRTPVTGARYTAPSGATNRVIDMTNGVMVFEGGTLSVPLTNLVALSLSNKIADGSLTNQLRLSLTLSNGVFSGSVRLPGATGTNLLKGALLQGLDSGFGYFLGTDRSGSVLIQKAD